MLASVYETHKVGVRQAWEARKGHIRIIAKARMVVSHILLLLKRAVLALAHVSGPRPSLQDVSLFLFCIFIRVPLPDSLLTLHSYRQPQSCNLCFQVAPCILKQSSNVCCWSSASGRRIATEKVSCTVCNDDNNWKNIIYKWINLCSSGLFCISGLPFLPYAIGLSSAVVIHFCKQQPGNSETI